VKVLSGTIPDGQRKVARNRGKAVRTELEEKTDQDLRCFMGTKSMPSAGQHFRELIPVAEVGISDSGVPANVCVGGAGGRRCPASEPRAISDL
jgi:hypothetical protein